MALHWGHRPRGTAQKLREFAISDRGAVAIYFGLSMIVFIGVAGLAVDAARGYLVKARLSEAVDAAALAGGKALQMASSDQKPKQDATRFFEANFPNGAMGATVSPPTVTIENNSTVVKVSSTATIPTTLMRVLGFNTMTVAASATVARATSGLDVVFSFDISQSMCQPCSKIAALRSNAKALVDSLSAPFTNGLQSQNVNINGVDYSLLNIGVVPWSSKVNVKTFGKEGAAGTITKSATTFQDPMGRRAGPQSIYFSSSSEVPLLYDPLGLDGGWTGCVYARYRDDGDSNDDADLTLGSVTAAGKEWMGWEPMANDESDGRSSGGFCDQAAWNQGFSPAWDGSPRPANWPTLPPSLQDTHQCSICPTVGILPLQSDTDKVKAMIDALRAGGATNAPQGLFWAWEVLMPGEPFNEAKVNPPFSRAQAIVLMTDGQSTGSNGDAYHGWFGPGAAAASITSKGNMQLPDGTSVKDNYGNRLLALSQKIKGSHPLDTSAVKIYVIQYTENDPALADLLSAVATQPTAPYYFYAPDEASLQGIFNQIAASLSALRIVQ